MSARTPDDSPLPIASTRIARLVGWCSARATLVVVVGTLLGIAAAVYCARNMAIDTDTAKLIPADLPWRQREVVFDRAFPQRVDLIAVVVDAATPEQGELAAAALARRLDEDRVHFKAVRRPDGGPFFDREGLLFSSVEEIDATLQRLIAAQPMLGTLAADPSLRGIADTIALLAEGVRRDPASAAQVVGPLAALAEAFEATMKTGAVPFSWRALMTGGKSDPRELRRFVLVQPVLDYASLQPGAAATQAIRAAARALGLVAERGVRVRLTGAVPLADEELATLGQGAGLDAAAMTVALIGLLWLALRSWRLVLAVVGSLLVGLAITTALGLLAFGRLNLISVAFAVLFVGLGVDFGIQFCVAYRANRVRLPHLDAALCGAASEVGGGLALAALSTALAFYAFVPTDYRGVSELGVIAGTGMIIAFLASVTYVPALICVLRAPPETAAIGYRQLAPLDGAIERMRRGILVAGLLLALGSLALVPRVKFDFNPLDLKSPATESMATLLDLAGDPNTTPNTIDVLAPSVAQAIALGERLSRLPAVDHVLTVGSFVPEQQDPKLALVQDAALLLDPVLHPVPKPPPADGEVVAALAHAADALGEAQREAAPAAAAVIASVAGTLRRVAQSSPAQRERAHAVLVPTLTTMLEQLGNALAAEPVTLASLPPDLVRDWVAPDGRARVEVYPKGDGNDNATLVRFVDAVRSVAPEATGAPVSIQESSRTIVRAFVEAGVWALLGIVLLLALTLRHVKSIALTLAPLLLAGVTTLGACALTGFALNFENIIALPLLFGIGVAFDIYFIMAWRAGRAHVLESSLTRAVLFSALTTGTAFGSLWLSAHPGTSSMGKLLALSLALTLAAVLVFLPALLRTVAPARD